MASKSSIDTPHLTGVTSIMAVVFCIGINSVHFYLSKTSKRRQTLFGRKLVFWSHLSMAFMSLCPLFVFFSYIHPERLSIFGDKNACLCQQWFAYSVIAFATGLFLLKMNYLVRLNMVLNPGSTKKCSTMLSIYFGILTCELITINTIQYMVIDGDCHGMGDYGCNTKFAEWNGWLTTGILFHDMALYYLFCVYYIRRVKGTLSKKSFNDLSKLQMAVGAPSVETTETSARDATVNSQVSQMDSKLSVQSVNSNSDSRAFARNRLKYNREKRKLTLVYNGLIRQFRITLIAIGICAVDLVCNTIWMDYNMLWLNMLDVMAVVVLNFFAFRDSQYLIMSVFEWCKQFGCESFSLLIDICCCMKENDTFSDDDTTIATTKLDETGTNATGVTENSSTTGQATPDEYEDSFLRYDEEHQDDGNGTSNGNNGQDTDITARAVSHEIV